MSNHPAISIAPSSKHPDDRPGPPATRPVPTSPCGELDAAVLALRDLMLVTLRFRQLVADHLNLDLSASVALSQLSAHGPLGAGQLADLVGVTPSSMTALLDRLENQDLARRTPHPTDRRKIALTITEHGHDSLTAVRSRLADALRDIDTAALPDAANTLAAITKGLDAQAELVRNHADRRRPARTHPSSETPPAT